jgi:aminoglycoside phosphotransferase family enzyme
MMDVRNLPDFIRYLLNPGSYPHRTDDVRLVQTHISYVLLAGDFVYKFKKPMNFGFLNFSTLSKRKHYCNQEILLNRRLCPTIYLGLVSVNKSSGSLSLNGPGEPVEYGVKMVRMPEEKMMVNIIQGGNLTYGMLDDIAVILESFYEKAACCAEINKFGTPEAVSVNVLENLKQSEPYVGCESLSREEYDQIERYVKQFLYQKEIFARRIKNCRIRDCHGDLHSRNICIADQVYIYDCIEFNHRFRYSDVASDVAFLAMDLDYHGLDKFSEHFINRFIALSGDFELTEVLHFYKCYRAAVRGKIGLLTAHEPEVDEETRTQNLGQATRYFRLAQRYAATG